MSKTIAIYKKDLKSYFLSPIAYVLMGVYLTLSGLFFYISTIGSGVASMEYVFGNMIFVFLVISPILTMKLISEEKKTGTDQLLLTSPLRSHQIVLGKYFAALTVYFLIILITFIYPGILYFYSRIDLGPVFSGYLGILFIGAAFLSAGLFASSLSENQIISGVVGFCILLISWSINYLSTSFEGPIQSFIEYLSIIKHYNEFEMGIIDLGNIVYYISYIAIFLFLTTGMVNKTWSRG